MDAFTADELAELDAAVTSNAVAGSGSSSGLRYDAASFEPEGMGSDVDSDDYPMHSYSAASGGRPSFMMRPPPRQPRNLDYMDSEAWHFDKEGRLLYAPADTLAASSEGKAGTTYVPMYARHGDFVSHTADHDLSDLLTSTTKIHGPAAKSREQNGDTSKPA